MPRKISQLDALRGIAILMLSVTLVGCYVIALVSSSLLEKPVMKRKAFV